MLTHEHIDHLGLVQVVADRSGADVAAIDVAIPFVENFGEDAERDDREAAEVDAAARDRRGRRRRAAQGDRELP